jgi:peptidoglycan/xylan/chitin deacetylase (PgdA/CDA1 family)
VSRSSGAPVPVLMYHEVSASPHPAFQRYTVTVREFTRQMRLLAALGYETIDLDTLVRARAGRGSLPRRPVIITFDDGYQGSVDHAVPVLRGHNFIACFYLVAGLMGETSRWMVPELGVDLPLMGWDTARKLGAEGFQFGAHTMTHPRLTDVDSAACRTELDDARKYIEQELSRPAIHLAYPFGSYDRSVQVLAAEAGYVTACSTRPGLSPADDDLLALHRVSVYGHDSIFDFLSRLRTGVAVRENLNGALDSVTNRLRIGSRS